jgi:hypothetical protein
VAHAWTECPAYRAGDEEVMKPTFIALLTLCLCLGGCGKKEYTKAKAIVGSKLWLGWFVLVGIALHVGIQLTLTVGILGYHYMLAIIFLFAIPGGLIYPERFLKKPSRE